MIRWIQSRQWLPKVLLASTFFLIAGGFDFFAGSIWALLLAVIVAVAIFFAPRNVFLTAGLLVLASAWAWYFKTGATLSLIGFLIALYLVASSSRLVVRVSIFVLAFASLLGLLLSQNPTSFVASNQSALAVEIALVVTAVAATYFLSRLAITRAVHVGTPIDQRVASVESARLNLRMAEQEERFQIAREISEVILQDITAILSQAEGGAYAAKLDPAVAARVLERVSTNARSAHQELRRLYDQLNRNIGIQAAPPGIDDLEAQVVLLREFGFTASLNHSGDRFEISEGAGLAIYRLVFDALENVKEHAPTGSSVSVDFSWVGEGLQILVKDNGIETKNRAARAAAESSGQAIDTDYTVDEDFEALVKPITGPSITAMRERAALYGGAIDATRVPGVGFTVSAIFPQLRNLAGDSQE